MGEPFRYQVSGSRTALPAGFEELNLNDLPDESGRWEQLVATADHDIDDWAFDLRQVARAVYLADRISRRHDAAFDRWTRHIELRIPVSDPASWQAGAAGLSALLGILSADVWDIGFLLKSRRHAAQADLSTWRASEVATFSGGLDSGAYAAERSRDSGGPLLLVGFHHARMRRHQLATFASIQHAARRPMRLLHLHQRPERRDLDASQRTRGLLYVTAIVFAAAGHGLSSVAIPENGAMAMNTPLTASRLAACSTRSVHPMTLHLFNQLIALIGGNVEAVNPYQGLTKGDVCHRARTYMSEAAVWTTVSCGHPHHRTTPNCGHCYPCLVRRSGLLAAYGRDETCYAVDLNDVDVNSARASSADLRAFTLRVRNPPTIDEILADLPLPDGTPAEVALEVALRAHHEMRDLLRAARPDL